MFESKNFPRLNCLKKVEIVGMMTTIANIPEMVDLIR